MRGLHACAIPKTFQESIAAAAPFLQRGLEKNQRCVFVAHDSGTTIVRMALRSSEPGFAAMEADGQLAIVDSKDTPLAGAFDAKRLYAAWRQMTEAALQDGFSGLRVVVEMTWALHLDVRSLADYERNARPLFEDLPLDALCIYSSQAFEEKVLLAAAMSGHQEHLLPDSGRSDSIDEFCRRLGLPRRSTDL